MTGSCRDDTVCIDIHSLHSQVLKDVDTQCESLLSAQFSLSKVRVPINQNSLTLLHMSDFFVNISCVAGPS